VVAERKRRLRHADSMKFLALLSELPIEVEQQIPEKFMRGMYSLARDAQLSTYDAAYLDLAMRKGLPLATLDKALRRAANDFNIDIFDKDVYPKT